MEKIIWTDRVRNEEMIQRIEEERNVFTCLLTPRSRVFHEKLNGSQLLKKFPALYGTRRFITAFASARHLSLS